jgi:hypothetical protein
LSLRKREARKPGKLRALSEKRRDIRTVSFAVPNGPRIDSDSTAEELLSIGISRIIIEFSSTSAAAGAVNCHRCYPPVIPLFLSGGGKHHESVSLKLGVNTKYRRLEIP